MRESLAGQVLVTTTSVTSSGRDRTAVGRRGDPLRTVVETARELVAAIASVIGRAPAARRGRRSGRVAPSRR